MANNKRIGVALVLSAMDRASEVINRMTNNAAKRMEGLSKRTGAAADTAFNAGQQMAAAGVAVGLPVLGAVKAFASQEQAMLSLQSTMMDAQGKISKSWEGINKLAISLGNELPGTTADFYSMFDVMIRNGSKASTVINGAGRAAAYLGMQLKIPYNEAAELATRMQSRLGIADKDMVPFISNLSKLSQMGVSVQEMNMGFARSAGALKTLSIQGLEASKKIGLIESMLIKLNSSGEVTGSSFTAMTDAFIDPAKMEKFNQVQKYLTDIEGKQLNIKFMDSKGNFLGLDNMMAQFDKIGKLDNPKKNALLKVLFGEGQDKQSARLLSGAGIDKYNEGLDAMNNMADIQMTINHQLKGLNNRWDAISGTMENVAASIATTLKPEIDGLLNWIDRILPKIQTFIERHRTIVKVVLGAAVGFTGLALAGAYLAFTVGGIMRGISTATFLFGKFSKGINLALKAVKFAAFAMRFHFAFTILPALQKVGTAFTVFGRALLTNPLTLYIGAALILAGAVYVIYRNWDSIAAWFSEKWEAVKTVFGAVWDWMTGWVGRWYNAGGNIVMSIAQGITDKVLLIKKVMGDVADKIRSYLPFSPAKEGALRDIHRVKLIETIAQGIKADAVLDKMRMVTERVRKVWDDGTSGLGIDTGNVLANVGMRAAGGGNVSVQSAPVQFNLTVNLNGSATKQDAERLGGMMQSEFEKMMDRYLRNKERVSY